MFKKIIWATDGSPAAGRALEYAKGLAQQEGASLVVVHVVETYGGSRAAGLAVYAEEAEIEKAVEKHVEDLQSEGIDASLKMIRGPGVHAAHAIADAASEEGANLIVTGTRGHTSITGLLVGSVTHRLLHIAPCPVMAVPGPAGDAEPEASATATASQTG